MKLRKRERKKGRERERKGGEREREELVRRAYYKGERERDRGVHVIMNGVVQRLRCLVSRDKHRLKLEGFDFDLTYITSRCVCVYVREVFMKVRE